MVQMQIRLVKPLAKVSMVAALLASQISNLRFQINCKTRISTLATSPAVKVNLNKTLDRVHHHNMSEEEANSSPHQVDRTDIT